MIARMSDWLVAAGRVALVAAVWCGGVLAAEGDMAAQMREALEALEAIDFDSLEFPDGATREEARAELEKALRFLRGGSQIDVNAKRYYRAFAEGLKEFRASKAYSVLDAGERVRFAAMEREIAQAAKSGISALAESAMVFFGAGPTDGETQLPREVLRRARDVLREGDVVMIFSEGGASAKFRDMSRREKRFSHGAIAVRGARGIELAGVWDGGAFELSAVRLAAWEDVVSGASDLAVYRLDGGASGGAIARAARKEMGKPFDFAFDLSTDDRRYCLEFLRAVLNDAAGRELVGTATIDGFEFVPPDAVYANLEKVFDAKEAK